MNNFIIQLLIICAFLIASNNVYASTAKDNGTNVTWVAVFENITPQNKNISMNYCLKHTPSTIITNINQITSKNGIRSINGVNIKYLSYKGNNVNGLHFNVVKGIVFGNIGGTKWQEPINLYEQTLDEIGKTWTVWSTPSCKGTFTGYPTVIDNTIK